MKTYKTCIFGVVVAVALACGGPAFAQDWVPIADLLRASVLRVAMQSGQGQGTCSAVVFEITPNGRAHALTAAHCVSAAPNDRLDVTIDNRSARTMVSNTVLDLAIVQFRPSGNTRTVVLAPESPKPGTPVTAAGFAFGIDEVAYQFGHVAQTRNRETKALWVNIDLIFGDSGGGIFDAQGRLIGITSMIYARGPAHMGGAVSIEDVRAFVDDYRDRLSELDKKQP